MLSVKASTPYGCTFLGKGIVNRPEMGVVCECRLVRFDEWDVMRQCWTGRGETQKIMYRTDNGYSFDHDSIVDGTYQIEQYAANWRARKPDAWGSLKTEIA